ncbi:hypothetical protein ACFSLT_17465 [Novosphingobium resinovorum]
MTNAFDKRYYEARSLSGSRGFTSRYYGDPRMYGASALHVLTGRLHGDGAEAGIAASALN